MNPTGWTVLQTDTLRYDPKRQPSSWVLTVRSRPTVPKKDHFRIVQPGLTVGGPIVKDRLWFFLGFAPEYQLHG